METTLSLAPGITLRCRKATRFKQGALSIQFLRPMRAEEAAKNALIPAVLLRGCEAAPDMQRIIARLDDLYGASIGALVRRIGDYQTTGFYCGFVEDRFALAGDQILAPMLEFAGQLLLEPVLENGAFCECYVESEKKNLISTIDSQRSDKRAYAAGQLLKILCKGDSFAIPRLGEREDVEKITARSLYDHYQALLREYPIEIYYVGSAEAETLAGILAPILEKLPRNLKTMPAQKPLQPGKAEHKTEAMDIAQGKLSLGFVTPITNRDSRFAAMQLFNSIFGGGMTSKIFNRIREELSYCYDIGSGYYSTKGILTVHAGIDFDREAAVRREVLELLTACQVGNITQQELDCAREYLLSGLRAVYDSPGAMENYFATAALSGASRTPEAYARQLQAVTVANVVAAAQTVQLHSSFFLTGTTN